MSTLRLGVAGRPQASSMEREELILFLLRRFPGLSDDELSRLSGLAPVRRVARICRDLANRRLLERRTGPNGKIANYVLDAEPCAVR